MKMTIEQIRADILRRVSCPVYDPALHIRPKDIKKEHGLDFLRSIAVEYDLEEIEVFYPDTGMRGAAFRKKVQDGEEKQDPHDDPGPA